MPISRACQSHRGSGRTEQTSVPLSVCRLMQVNPCTRAVATALGGLVSLRWDRRASLTLLAQELRWLSSDSLPTSTESRPTQTKQLLRTVTRRRGVTCFISKRCAACKGRGCSLSGPAKWGVHNSYKAWELSVTLCVYLCAVTSGKWSKDTTVVHVLPACIPLIHVRDF